MNRSSKKQSGLRNIQYRELFNRFNSNSSSRLNQYLGSKFRSLSICYETRLLFWYLLLILIKFWTHIEVVNIFDPNIPSILPEAQPGSQFRKAYREKFFAQWFQLFWTGKTIDSWLPCGIVTMKALKTNKGKALVIMIDDNTYVPWKLWHPSMSQQNWLGRWIFPLGRQYPYRLVYCQIRRHQQHRHYSHGPLCCNLVAFFPETEKMKKFINLCCHEILSI